ncbi:rhodanese-like domain-containing protein [Jeotgalibaca caeni]|uniref:rhodanese-like domain-containing protein n=1 Tax=Jeotgalibaca caeni TaxID=3028623 RepID=UPI00237E442E|nr:rhodanese-like domain-containing protein [Jeotgalibaca caeni]MDE1549406.1 rhodanese-like domain-containing protein [Jeotgalibaca caeni]
MYHSISMPEFDVMYRRNRDLNILDVREEDEYKRGHIPGAKSIPLSDFPFELKKGNDYYVICQSGARSAAACQYLANNGYEVTNVIGGMSTWKGEKV